MNEAFLTIPPYLIILPVLLVVLNEGLKNVFCMPPKIALIVNWTVGLILGVVMAIMNQESAVIGAIWGFLLGSSASGIYDSRKLISTNDSTTKK